MAKSDNTYTCCICHREFTGWGNNPDPYKPEDGNDRCCDDCNVNFVIPKRLELFHSKMKAKLHVN